MDFVAKNEFEYDWCTCACDEAKTTARKLVNSRWLICGLKGDDFFYFLVRFLRFMDRRFDLGLSITVLAEQEELQGTAELFPYAQVKRLSDADEPIEAEYCVFCGYAGGRAAFSDEAEYAHALKRMETFWNRIAKSTRRSICVSDAQVYDAYGYPLAAAEGEFQEKTGCMPRRFYREMERTVRQTQREYVVLRPCTILAAGETLESDVSAFLDELIFDSSRKHTIENRQYSILYITDFLAAFLRAANDLCPQEVYNVSADETTVSMIGLCDLVSRINPGMQMDICLKQEDNRPSYAVNGEKLRAQGWKPTVDLYTMLTLYIKARRGETEELWFADGHHGKLPVIHRQLLRILCEVDRICKKHGIQYFLAGGTLLGAVRHQGFIPWDDDLDVMMLRRDYDRFMEAARQELSDAFFLQIPDTDPGCHYLISKIRLNGTVFSSEFLTRYPSLHNGLFVDIIAQDYTANHPMAQKLHMKLSLLARGLVFKKWSGASATEINKAYVVFDVMKTILPISVLERFQDNVLRMFNRKKGRRFLYDSMGINIAKGVYPAKWLSESVELPFEGKLFPVPVEYDAYLRYLYGEYVQLPPVSQRRTVHAVKILDMGTYAEE